LIVAIEAEMKRRKGEKSAGKPKRQPPMKKSDDPKTPKPKPEAGKKELKKVPQLKKAGKKETDMA